MLLQLLYHCTAFPAIIKYTKGGSNQASVLDAADDAAFYLIRAYYFTLTIKYGIPPISIIGLGRTIDSSDIRVPRPPA